MFDVGRSSFSDLTLLNISLLFVTGDFTHHHKQHGIEKNPQQGGQGHPSKQGHTHDNSGFRTRARGHHQGQHPQNKRKGRHQYGSETQSCGFHRRIKEGKALVELQFGKLHNQDSILRRHGNEHHQGDLAKDVELVALTVQPRYIQGQEGAEDGKGRSQQDTEGQ